MPVSVPVTKTPWASNVSLFHCAGPTRRGPCLTSDWLVLSSTCLQALLNQLGKPAQVAFVEPALTESRRRAVPSERWAVEWRGVETCRLKFAGHTNRSRVVAEHHGTICERPSGISRRFRQPRSQEPAERQQRRAAPVRARRCRGWRAAHRPAPVARRSKK